MANKAPNTSGPPTMWRLRLYRIGGVLVWLGTTVGSGFLAPRHPWLIWIPQLVAWYIGKLLGIPFNDVLSAALARKTPAEVAEIAVKAIMTMPVAQINPVARAVVESVRPIALERLTSESQAPRPMIIPVDDLVPDEPHSEK